MIRCKYHSISNGVCPNFFDSNSLNPLKKGNKGRCTKYKYFFVVEEDDVGLVNGIDILEER